jgi:beta-galactosidase
VKTNCVGKRSGIERVAPKAATSLASWALRSPSARLALIGLLLAGCALRASAGPLAIDVTKPAPASTLQLNQGSFHDPQGHALTVDSQSLLLDGQPWVTIAGEFHYGRYAQPEWREELEKMKAGGCTAVSIYILWIWHEEIRGQWDWSGQRSLRDFIQLAQQVGLKVIMRIGPWAHGEARNGGFPDWVQNSHTRLRTTDPAFLALVRPFYEQIAAQTSGLYWKDGGPIVGVQVDNECDNPEYLLALKAMARQVGIDAPFYLMTGWNRVPIPKKDLLPVFGAYAWGLWQKGPSFQSFVFTLSRNDRDMGAPLPAVGKAPVSSATLDPYLTAELGGGMQSSYLHRVDVQPEDVASINLVRLGDGNTMPGFYMYQGGINPTGQLSFLNEAHPNELPPKDYDFSAPLGAWGEVREHYHLLREQNLFLQDFGPEMIRMPAYLPQLHTRGLTDVQTVRWAVRWKDDAGFLLFNNYAPELAFPDHPGVQFSFKTPLGSFVIPREPITIPAGDYGLWAVHLDCQGARLLYATAQPICHLDQGRDRWYFFRTLPGIDADFVFDRRGVQLTAGTEDPNADPGTLRLRHLTTGTGEAFALAKEDGSKVHFVLLDPTQARTLWRAPFAGADHVILSRATVLAEDGKLRLQAEAAPDFSFAIFPPVSSVHSAGGKFDAANDGVFQRFTPRDTTAFHPPEIKPELIQAAAVGQPELPATDEKAWKNAAVWKLHVPAEAAGRHLLVQVHYLADAARLYAGDTLIDDNYYDTKAFDFGLWRIPPAQMQNLTLRIVPYSAKLLPRLPDPVAQRVAAMDPADRDKVTTTVVEQKEMLIAPDSAP